MKKEFFYNQKRLVDWLDDHREIFGLEQKSIQPYVSLWLNDGPSLPSGAKHVLDSVETMALNLNAGMTLLKYAVGTAIVAGVAAYLLTTDDKASKNEKESAE